MKTLLKSLPQQPNQELVGTPTEIKGGLPEIPRIAKVSELKTDNTVEEKVPRVKSVVFTTEEIWGRFSQRSDDARLKLSEAGTEEDQIVFVQQVFIHSERDLVWFTDVWLTERFAWYRRIYRGKTIGECVKDE